MISPVSKYIEPCGILRFLTKAIIYFVAERFEDGPFKDQFRGDEQVFGDTIQLFRDRLP